MPEVDLDSVESGCVGTLRRADVVGDDPVDVGLCARLGQRHPRGSGDPGRAHRGHSVGRGVGNGGGVADLRRDRRAIGVDGVGELAQHSAVVHAPVVLMLVGAALGRSSEVSDGRHPHTATGVLGVEFDELIGDAPLGAAALEGRRLDDAAPQRDVADLSGAEYVGGRCTGSKTHVRIYNLFHPACPVPGQQFYRAGSARQVTPAASVPATCKS